MKTYILHFEDKQGNDLKTIEIEAKNNKEARSIASKLQANSMINDLYKITVRLK